jgi:transglutaminase-like putative cysteine protease
MAGELMIQDLKPTYFIDSDSPDIGEFARAATGKTKSDLEKAIKLYYAVRDGITYNPYSFSLDNDSFRASFIFSKGDGWCVQKAILLAAVGRAAGIPSRLRFANVKNHLATERLKALMKTDLFVFHGLTEFYLEGRWLKATPAFNLSLCEKFGVLPLEFDGRNDSVFHPFDKNGRRHMEYTHDYGPFDDFPYEVMMMEMRKYYPHFFSDEFSKGSVAPDSFEAEAARERDKRKR